MSLVGPLGGEESLWVSLWTTFWGLKPVPEELGFLGPSSRPFMDSGSLGLALVCSELSPGVAGPRCRCVGPRLSVLQVVPGSSGLQGCPDL